MFQLTRRQGAIQGFSTLRGASFLFPNEKTDPHRPPPTAQGERENTPAVRLYALLRRFAMDPPPAERPACCAAAEKRAAQLEALARNLAAANKLLIAEGAQRASRQASVEAAVAAVQARLAELTAASAASEAENAALRERLAHSLRSSELLEKRVEAESARSALETELSGALRAESDALRSGFGSKLEALEAAFNREVAALRAGGEQREGALEAALKDSHAREVRLREQLEEFGPQLASLSDKFNETLESRQREAEAVRGAAPAHSPRARARTPPARELNPTANRPRARTTTRRRQKAAGGPLRRWGSGCAARRWSWRPRCGGKPPRCRSWAARAAS